MPLAVTHVLLTIILVDLYRDYFAKYKYFTLHTVLVAGIAGLLPDIDIPLNWALGLLGYTSELLRHGGVTHSVFFGLVFLIPAFAYLQRRRHRASMYFFAVCFGILFHLLLDFLLGGSSEGLLLFWPLTGQAFGLLLLAQSGLIHAEAAIDAIILLLWLYYAQTRNKIRDFI